MACSRVKFIFRGALKPVTIVAEKEADHSVPTGGEDKSPRACTSTPSYVILVW
jgi:hypothetical protein